MHKIMYVPFEDPKLRYQAFSTLSAHNSTHYFSKFRQKVFLPTDSNNALQFVLPTQEVYVVAHGRPGTRFIFDNKDEKLSVEDLAIQLSTQKLTKNIRVVKLYACNSGLDTESAQATANQLYVALVAQGFNKVEVYGYAAYLYQKLVSDGHKMATPDKKIAITATSVRKKFNMMSQLPTW